ncbi:glycosyltransferase [Parabacteroides sp. AF14-59]|uniref:glycosyltransferase n=1 Tax=Parabacteroides sp. AF14-59 TaxID=2292240 RepID=UPI000EFE99B5|nr:glycosyltransferase [Parabacteroides sp. AF14-59]RHR93629.1 glycosyltransferase [Parabacteroides sp. AF14-59]
MNISNISFDGLLDEALSYLILNCGFSPDLGLFHGKMGYILFFVHYARYSHNKQFETFAYELLDDLYEDVNKDLPINFEYGLCGIGWGIEFLVQNGFIEGDTDEILKEIDRRVMEYDVFHFSDFSFRTGLGGIVFYVIARLSAQRDKFVQVFDKDYLDALKYVLLYTEFTEKDELPPFLIDTYLKILDREKVGVVCLPAILSCINLCLSENLSSISLGLYNGIAGHLLYCIQREELTKNEVCVFSNNSNGSIKRKSLVIFNEESQASNYGVGNYIKELIRAFQDTEWELVVIHLRSYRGKTIFMERIGDVLHYFVSNVRLLNGVRDTEKQNRLYYRSILLLLYPFLSKLKNPVFQLNYMKMSDLASGLKKLFPRSKVVVTIHYVEWRFSLMGDKAKLHEILSHPDKKENITLCKSLESEKVLLNLCDHVIAVAKHSYDDLRKIYKVPKEKLIYIPHGIEDSYSKLARKDFLSLKRKYGYTEEEKILVIAGRLSPAKGCGILAKSFVDLIKEYPQLRLIIIGDGDYTDILLKITPYWSKVSFTGYVNKQILYELLSISDIGVLPSFYEEFGYVALEMMMMGLPLIVGRTTGLSELVLDGETGITVPLYTDENKSEENVEVLKSGIKRMLDNPELCKQYATNGRIRYLEKYNFDDFNQSLVNFFVNIF